MSDKESKRGGKSSPNASKKIRNAKILADSIAGKKNAEISRETGLSRQQITKILTSDETKSIIKEAESKITNLIHEAVETVSDAMRMRHEPSPGAMGNALSAAIKVLKNSGLLKESVQLEHSFPKPTVIERLNGSQVILGTMKEEEE